MFPANNELTREARGILKRDLLIHIGAILIIPICGFVISQLSYFVLFLLYDMVSATIFTIIDILFSVFAVVMIIPLVYGYAVFLYESIAEKNTDIKNMFYSFSTAKLFERSYSLFLALFLRAILYFSVPCLFLYCFYRYSSGSSIISPVFLFGFDASYALLFFVTVIAFSVSLALFAKYSTAIYLAVSDEEHSVSYCFLRANVYNFNFKLKYFFAGMKFIPLILISVVTLGILFIIYTLPLMLITYTVYAKHICHFGNSIKMFDINRYKSISDKR